MSNEVAQNSESETTAERSEVRQLTNSNQNSNLSSPTLAQPSQSKAGQEYAFFFKKKRFFDVCYKEKKRFYLIIILSIL